jgi:hypothetical protein
MASSKEIKNIIDKNIPSIENIETVDNNQLTSEDEKKLKKKEYMKLYREKNKEKYKEYQKKWRDSKKDDDIYRAKCAEHTRKYYHKIKSNSDKYESLQSN